MSHAHASDDEDRFRCFVFEFDNPFVPSEGLQLAQSGDATCNGLFSPNEGSRTMKLTRGKKEEQEGLLCMGKWITMTREKDLPVFSRREKALFCWGKKDRSGVVSVCK